MYAVKTALRESFDSIHVGFRYNSIDETIKIETDRGKIGRGKILLVFVYLTPMCYPPRCFTILTIDESNFLIYFNTNF